MTEKLEHDEFDDKDWKVLAYTSARLEEEHKEENTPNPIGKAIERALLLIAHLVGQVRELRRRVPDNDVPVTREEAAANALFDQLEEKGAALADTEPPPLGEQPEEYCTCDECKQESEAQAPAVAAPPPAHSGVVQKLELDPVPSVPDCTRVSA